LQTASRKARSCRDWQRIKDLGGILGVIQNIEVHYTQTGGWHYHAHLLVPCLASPEAALAALNEFIDLFMAKVKAMGGKAERVGQDVQIIDARSFDDSERVAAYATKGSMAWEIAGGG
jgi:hypothetical protein